MTRKQGAIRYDADKPDISLIPPEFITDLSRVYMFGVQKYARENWRKGMKWSRMYNSAMRHLLAFWGGEMLDSETKLPHLLHAVWNILSLYWYTKHFPKLDDRWLPKDHAATKQLEDN